MRNTATSITAKKSRGTKISMLTAYDYCFAAILDQAGIDMILVGDSMANVILGLDSTSEISLEEMLNHSRAVVKATGKALIVGDMPFCASRGHAREITRNARRFIEEAGCQAIKLEWAEGVPNLISALTGEGIAVMGHIGFTPQTKDISQGSVIQGKTAAGALALIKQAQQLEQAGCFSLVLECIPQKVSKIITERLSIPTIGIGAGPECDGQVLVLNDILGLYKKMTPRFVRRYTDLYQQTKEAVLNFKADLENLRFPGPEESFSIKTDEYLKLIKALQ